jgi:hypothetical protein
MRYQVLARIDQEAEPETIVLVGPDPDDICFRAKKMIEKKYGATRKFNIFRCSKIGEPDSGLCGA